MGRKYLNYRTDGYISYSLDDPDSIRGGDVNVFNFIINALGSYFSDEPEELYDGEVNEKEDLTEEEIAKIYCDHYDGFSITEEPEGPVINVR